MRWSTITSRNLAHQSTSGSDNMQMSTFSWEESKFFLFFVEWFDFWTGRDCIEIRIKWTNFWWFTFKKSGLPRFFWYLLSTNRSIIRATVRERFFSKALERSFTVIFSFKNGKITNFKWKWLQPWRKKLKAQIFWFTSNFWHLI